jgi:hypothetical protein
MTGLALYQWMGPVLYVVTRSDFEHEFLLKKEKPKK